MASFADNNLAMAFLPVTICKWISRGVSSVVKWIVQTLFVCLLSKPQALSKVRVRGVTSSSFKVVWKRAPVQFANPVVYEMQIREPSAGQGAKEGRVERPGTESGAEAKDGATDTWRTIHRGEEPMEIVRHLKPDTIYEVRARMKNIRGQGPFCDPVEVRTFRRPSLGMGSTGPLLNGDRYAWEQTLKEVTLRFKMPSDTTSSQLQVDYATDRVSIRNKVSGEVLLEGQTRNKIKPDGCVWSRDPDTGEILVDLEKSFPLMETPYMWSCVFKGHPQIDCSLGSDGGATEGLDTSFLEEALADKKRV